MLPRGSTGANIFWVDRGQVAARLGALPLVRHVDVNATLPDTVEISIWSNANPLPSGSVAIKATWSTARESF